MPVIYIHCTYLHIYSVSGEYDYLSIELQHFITSDVKENLRLYLLHVILKTFSFLPVQLTQALIEIKVCSRHMLLYFHVTSKNY